MRVCVAPSHKDSHGVPEGLGGEESEKKDVRFPRRLRHNGKGKVLVTIYKHPDFYRDYWRERRVSTED